MQTIGLNNSSPLQTASLKGILASQSALQSQAGNKKTAGLAGLMLTSLIDAFCILVIFLLSNANNTGSPIEAKGKIQLPASSRGEAFTEGTTLRVLQSGGGALYFVNDKPVNINQLTATLVNLKNKTSLIVQADKKIPFQDLNPIILAASHSGFEKFQFAVIPRDAVVKGTVR
jgi:biopolymer transport protein ExbD